MNKGIVAIGYPTREMVRIRTGRDEHEFRRMWGGIAWPEFPKGGATCIVGELMPDGEDVELGQLILLDQETGNTIEDLLLKTINLKDHYYAKRFYADARNNAWMEKFTFAHGLTRYKKGQDIEMFPYYKEDWLRAYVDEAPQADNPEFGLQLMSDWLYHENRLKIEVSVQKAFEKEGVLPVTKDMIKTGIPPVICALRYILAAYFQNPFRSRRGRSTGFSNWSNRNQGEESKGNYQEIYVK